MDFTSKDKVLRLLEQAAASLDGSMGEDLGPAFKRYRQAVFKLNYKINKLNAAKRGAAKVCARALEQRLPVWQQAAVFRRGRRRGWHHRNVLGVHAHDPARHLSCAASACGVCGRPLCCSALCPTCLRVH